MYGHYCVVALHVNLSIEVLFVYNIINNLNKFDILVCKP